MATKIGSIEHASTLANYKFPKRRTYDWAGKSFWEEQPEKRSPRGFKFLGAGWSRNAFLGPDGFVYKKPKQYDGEGGTIKYGIACNKSEAERFRVMSDSLKEAGYDKVRLAKCRLFKSVNVLAMEYVQGIKEDWNWTEMNKLNQSHGINGLYRLGLDDLHTGNAFLDSNGVLVIIDYAESDIFSEDE